MIKKALRNLLLCTLPAAALANPVEEVVTIATGSAAPLDQLALSAALIDAEQIALLGAQHAAELLNREPGVLLQRGSGQEYLPALRSPVFTGAGACGELLIMEQGIALNANGFCNINELFNAHTERAAAVEMIRGPGTVLYGSNALHGVVDVAAPDLSAANTLRAEWAQRDFQRLSLAVNGGDDSQRLGLAVTTAVDGGSRDSSGYKQNKLTLQHHYRGVQWQVESGLVYTHLNQETASYVEGFESYADKTLRRQNLDPQAYRNATAVRAWSHWRKSSEGGTLSVKPYLRSANMDFLMHFLPGTPIEENRQYSVGLQLRWQSAEQGGRSWLLGVDGELTEGELQQYQLGEAPSFLQSQIPTGKHYDYRVDSWQLSPFARFNWQLSDALAVSAGLRLEQLDYRYDNRMSDGRTNELGQPCAAGCRYSRPSDRSDRFDNSSTELALNYQISADQRLFARYSRAFRAPQATELYRLQRQQLSAELDSPQLTALELGWSGSVGHWDYQLALYQMDKRHVIFRDSDFYNVSRGRTEHRGLELSSGYRLSPQWRLELAATLARHRYDNSPGLVSSDITGNEMDGAPRWFGRTALVWQPHDELTAELEWRAQAGYYLDIENEHRYSGHRLWNLRGRWQASAAVALSLRLLNITDELYADRADYTTFSAERYFPGARRTLALALDYQF